MNPTSTGPYAYSFDRETFLGHFGTRSQATEAGLRAARALPDTPATIFVAKRVFTAPAVHGFAETIIERIRHARDVEAELSSDFLARVGEHEQAELDSALAKTIQNWLNQHDFRTPDRMTAISEHPLPPIENPRALSAANGEVADLGSVDHVLDALRSI